MNEWMATLIDDIRKGSVVQFVATLVLIAGFTGYEVSSSLSPLTSTALMYWDGGFTEEELERSNLHNICDRMKSWPMNLFIEQDKKIDDRCKMLKRRHILRTSDDWKRYQQKVTALKGASKTIPPKIESIEGAAGPITSIAVTPKEMGLEEIKPP